MNNCGSATLKINATTSIVFVGEHIMLPRIFAQTCRADDICPYEKPLISLVGRWLAAAVYPQRLPCLKGGGPRSGGGIHCDFAELTCLFLFPLSGA